MAVFLESYGDKRNSGYHLNTNGDLCVLTKTTNDVSQNSYSLKNCHAESLVVQLWGETAAPGAIVIAKTDDNSDEHPVFPNNSTCEVPPVPLPLHDLRRINQPAALSLCHRTPRRRKADWEACRGNNAGRSVQMGPQVLDSRDEETQVLNLRDDAISATPHWDNFLTNLSVAADDDHRRDFIDFIHRHCFQEDLLWKNSSGDLLDHKMPLALKMETLFETAWQRRALALEHINGSSDVAVSDHTYELSSEQMQELSQLRLPDRGMLIVWARMGPEIRNIKTKPSNPKWKIQNRKSELWYPEYQAHGCYLPGGICWFNDWRLDVESWMKAENLSSYYHYLERSANGEKACYRKAHHMAKSGFSSYCHYLAGSKYLLRMLLQLPILAQCSAANHEPAEISALTKWMTDLQRVKQTQEYKDAVRKSKPALSPNHRRLSLQIWEASRELTEAKALSKKGLWDDLTQKEQSLVEAYDSGRLDRRMQHLISQQIPVYKSERREKHKPTATVIAEPTAAEPDSDTHPVHETQAATVQTSFSTARSATPPHHPKPKRVHTPALIKLEAGDFTSASGMVLQAHLSRGLQLEKDMNDAKRSFETAQTARAASIAATCQAESLTLPWHQNPTVVNLAKQRLKRFAERRRFRKGQRWRQLRR